MNTGFSDEQKRYLEGLASGLQVAQAMRGVQAVIAPAVPSAAPRHGGPDRRMLEAQERTLAAGGKLVPEEIAKRESHPLDRWDEVERRAASGAFPKGLEVFCTKYFGLFYVAPAQDSFMCRLRLPNGILRAEQMRGVAQIAARCGGGGAQVTTRANLQIRGIAARHAPAVVTALQDLGIVTRGAGADNIRNITGTPTAGIDPQELIDTYPLALAMHHAILNRRECYGLPRKFNIAFDGGGRISALEDTNDIGFAAVRVVAGSGVEPGVYFRLLLGGITGHKDFARDTGVLATPEECVAIAIAVVRVFIDYGDRTDRTRARLKYLLDAWGLDRFIAQVQAELPFPLRRVSDAGCEPRAPVDPLAHIGVHRQRQAGRCYIGVSLDVGLLTVEQMIGLADVAERFGSGALRLTAWQNLLVSDIADGEVEAAAAAIEALGLEPRPSPLRAGLVACTGNTGCRFSAADTKTHARAIAEWVEPRVRMDRPVNVHLTGCHHSCAQHYVGDIGLLACKVPLGENEEIEGYHLYAGGGYGERQALALEVARSVPAEQVPGVVERLLSAYIAERSGPDESFAAFARRHTPAGLRTFAGIAP